MRMQMELAVQCTFQEQNLPREVKHRRSARAQRSAELCRIFSGGSGAAELVDEKCSFGVLSNFCKR